MLKRIVPDFQPPPGAEYFSGEGVSQRASFLRLFEGRRLGLVLLLWAISFLLNIDLWIMHQWLPTLTRNMGESIAVAVRTGALFQLGGVIGGLTLGTYVDRRSNPWPALALAFALSAAAFFSVGRFATAEIGFFVVVFLTGALLAGAQFAFNGVVGHIFPTSLRTTGMAFTAGISRLGAMTGPLLVGLMLGSGWSQSLIYALGAIPALLCAASALVLLRRHGPTPEPSSIPVH